MYVSTLGLAKKCVRPQPVSLPTQENHNTVMKILVPVILFWACSSKAFQSIHPLSAARTVGCQRQSKCSRRPHFTAGLSMMTSGGEEWLMPTATAISSLTEQWTATTTATSLSMGSSIMMNAAQQYMTSPEPIHTAFSVATFLPQPFWLLMIVFPKSSVTKKIMGGLGTNARTRECWTVRPRLRFVPRSYTSFRNIAYDCIGFL